MAETVSFFYAPALWSLTFKFSSQVLDDDPNNLPF